MNVFRLYLILIVGSASIIIDGAAFAKVIDNRQYVAGTVVAVMRDGYMIVNPSSGSDLETISIRLWGYTVDSKALAMATLGRRIRCAIIYQTSAYVVDYCLVTYIDHKDTVSIEDLRLQEFGMGAAPLASILDSLGLGEYGCNEEDQEHLPASGISYHRDRCDL